MNARATVSATGSPAIRFIRTECDATTHTDPVMSKFVDAWTDRERNFWERRERDMREWYAEPEQQYTFPHCPHGSSRWTDYDNICGPCEDGDTSYSYFAARERAIDTYRALVRRQREILAVMNWMHERCIPIGDVLWTDFARYAQAIRDVIDGEGFYDSVFWPRAADAHF